MRNLIEIIGQILAKIPANQTELIEELKHIQNSAGFTAPEDMSRRWHQTAIILRKHFGDNPVDWQADAIDVFVGTKTWRNALHGAPPS